MVRKILLSLIITFSAVAMGFAQSATVKGKVTDSNNVPVIGATVFVEGTQNGTATDANGDFTLSAPSQGNLVVTYVGYTPQTVAIAGKTFFDVVLAESSLAIDDVVVVAFGSKRKQDMVGSISKVQDNIISNSQASSVSSALEGAVAGLQVVTSSGQPGDDASIVLRGIGSLSANNSALIVLDGVPFNGKLSDISTSDIASISVSKDAVTNSLYGSRASNGVVMVTTKSGSKSKHSINFKGSWGVSSRAYDDYDMVTDPGEFYEMAWYGIRNTQLMAGDTPADASQFATDNLLSELGNYNAFIIPNGEPLVGLDGKLNPNAKTRYNDTFADAMFDTSLRQEYIASASGGNDKTDYYLSMGYLDNDSYIIGSSFERLTTRLNLNSQVNKWLRVGGNISYSETESNGLQESSSAASNPFQVARDWAPIFPVYAYDAEGNVVLDDKGAPVYDAGTGQTEGTVSRPVATNQNVIANLYEDIRNSVRRNFMSRLFVEAKFLNYFTFIANYSYDYTNYSGTTYYTPTIGDGQSFGGRGTKSSANYITTNFNQILSYDRVIDKHSITAKLGHEYYNYEFDTFEGQKTNFFDPTNPELDNGGQMQYISSAVTSHNIEGYFAMADYNYDHKYYASAAFRRDGTSRFLDKWGNFWSVGAAWRLSSEEFMSSASWVNDLKIRANYGIQGNENIGYYTYMYTPYTDHYSVSWDGSQLSTNIGFYGNPDLTWEKQATLDLGVDFRLFDRLYGSINYFERVTDDMLFQVPQPTSTGRPYNWENIGSMKNSGLEIDINYDVFKTKDLRWTVSLVGATYKNVLLTLPEKQREEGIVSGAFKRMEGKSIYEYYTYEYAGINKDAAIGNVGAASWYTTDDEGNRVVTTDYSSAEKAYIGKSAIPDFTGGFSTTLTYKGIDLSIATAFQIGGYAYDSAYTGLLSSSFYVGHHEDMWDTYNPETGKGSIPVWDANNSSNSYTQTSDAHLVSASYFNIRNITVGYTLPKSVTEKLYMQNLRVYLTADNLALWSARQGFDPRVSLSGGNGSFSGYSPMKTISAGIEITF